jgi:hypothetical protein
MAAAQSPKINPKEAGNARGAGKADHKPLNNQSVWRRFARRREDDRQPRDEC